jgi:hypothetical protein
VYGVCGLELGAAGKVSEVWVAQLVAETLASLAHRGWCRFRHTSTAALVLGRKVRGSIADLTPFWFSAVSAWNLLLESLHPVRSSVHFYYEYYEYWAVPSTGHSTRLALERPEYPILKQNTWT